MTRLCVVGAGAAGAGVAHALRGTGIDVTLLEARDRVAGRAATRERHGCRYDYGANYVTDDGGRTTELVRSLGTDGLVDVAEPVWTFDADGDVEPGDPDRRAAHKWTWEGGIAEFVERTLERSDATVRTGTRVDGFARDGDAWLAAAADGDDRGPFDAVVLTPAAPRTAALLGEIDRLDGTAGTAGTDGLDGLEPARAAIESVTYRTVRSLVLHYDFRLERPWYALVDREKAHPIGWLSREECKRGHVPAGESLLVVQMSPSWSTERAGDPVESAAADASGRVAELVGDDRLRNPTWIDDRTWRHALPETGVAREPLEAVRDAGLLFAGDWVAGDGRVHAAFWSGVAVGERVPEFA